VDRGKRWKLKRVCHHPPINEALSSALVRRGFRRGALNAPALSELILARGSSDNLEDELGRGTSAVVFAIKPTIINGER